jgi:hypothetical protein
MNEKNIKVAKDDESNVYITGNMTVFIKQGSEDTESNWLDNEICNYDMLCRGCTLELPYRNNQRNISSIEEGTYKAVIKKSLTPGIGTTEGNKVIELLNVEGRDNILIHVGNALTDTKGCILIGNYIIDGFLYMSRAALDEIICKIEEHQVESIEVVIYS